MKPPTEAELIELENRILAYWELHFDYQYGVIETLRSCIELARLQLPPIPPFPPRNGKPEPVPSLQPKQKRKF